jgi:hypothetical protein
MNNLSEFVIKNSLKSYKNTLVIFLITLLSCLILYFIKMSNLPVIESDYFWVVWFIINIFYIYQICDISVYDFNTKIIQLVYSVGYSRNKYLINKLILFFLTGFIHSIIILLTYKFIFCSFILNQNNTNGLTILIIYPLIFLLISSFDFLLALFNYSKSKIILINFIIIVIIPTAIQSIVGYIDNKFLLALFNISPFKLISTAPLDLVLTYEMFLCSLLTIFIINIFNFSVNKRKDF